MNIQLKPWRSSRLHLWSNSVVFSFVFLVLFFSVWWGAFGFWILAIFPLYSSQVFVMSARLSVLYSSIIILLSSLVLFICTVAWLKFDCRFCLCDDLTLYFDVIYDKLTSLWQISHFKAWRQIFVVVSDVNAVIYFVVYFVWHLHVERAKFTSSFTSSVPI